MRKLSPDGSTLLYSQCLGANTRAGAIAVDASGNLLVAGASSSAGGGQHALVAKLSPSGSAIWTKPLGGSGMDGVSGLFVIVDGRFQTDMVPLYVKENPAEGLPLMTLRRRKAHSTAPC